MSSKRHNPERRSWRGRSHKKGGARVRELREHMHLYESQCPYCHPEILSQGSLRTSGVSL